MKASKQHTLFSLSLTESGATNVDYARHTLPKQSLEDKEKKLGDLSSSLVALDLGEFPCTLQACLRHSAQDHPTPYCGIAIDLYIHQTRQSSENLLRLEISSAFSKRDKKIRNIPVEIAWSMGGEPVHYQKWAQPPPSISSSCWKTV